jgi:hypothetical protein
MLSTVKQLSVAVLLSMSIAASAQQAAPDKLPPPFPRTNATALYENARIRVWDIVWPKGQPTALHRHPYDQVGTYYQRGGRLITQPDGTSRSNMTEVGSLSTTRKGTTHIEEGNTDPPLRAVFVELEQDTASGLPAAGIESTPALGDAGAKQVLDDDRVSAWDLTWSKGALVYRPARETVVVFLGDGQLEHDVQDARSRTPVHAGTMVHLDRGAADQLRMIEGSPRAILFEFK